jgi:hypothetical protein
MPAGYPTGMLAFALFLIAAVVAGICFFVPEVLRLRLLAAVLGLIAAGLAVGVYPG